MLICVIVSLVWSVLFPSKYYFCFYVMCTQARPGLPVRKIHVSYVSWPLLLCNVLILMLFWLLLVIFTILFWLFPRRGLEKVFETTYFEMNMYQYFNIQFSSSALPVLSIYSRTWVEFYSCTGTWSGIHKSVAYLAENKGCCYINCDVIIGFKNLPAHAF